MQSLKTTIVTKDNYKIKGNYYPGSLPFGVVMLHMMPATKESYAQLAEILAKEGYHALAIDLRGHGESKDGDFQSFSDSQHQDSLLDLEASVEFLLKHNPNMKIGLVGASIGANLAIRYASKHPTAFVAGLSPGINYKGLSASEEVEHFPKDLPVLFMSAKDDANVYRNFKMAESLYGLCASENKKLQIYDTGGHGTDIINHRPEAGELLVSWIKEQTNAEAKFI
jgi:alpha-beta hydrolase superfamily lysophospholipase